MTIEAQHAEHEHEDRLVKRVIAALGPPYDGAAELGNTAFAKRLVAALLALRVIHRSTDDKAGEERQNEKGKRGETTTRHG